MIAAAHRYEQGIPIEKRIQTATIRTEDSETLLMGRNDEEMSTEKENLSILYYKTLKKIQVQTFRLS